MSNLHVCPHFLNRFVRALREPGGSIIRRRSPGCKSSQKKVENYEQFFTTNGCSDSHADPFANNSGTGEKFATLGLCRPTGSFVSPPPPPCFFCYFCRCILILTPYLSPPVPHALSSTNAGVRSDVQHPPHRPGGQARAVCQCRPLGGERGRAASRVT